jgi:class 3 adenylate cyclase/tetratricopeptide (TPR) repeat protein
VAERRLVSVLFADLVGFTSLSESRDAEEVRELLSRYFDICRRLIELYGGVVEKFIGDAVMAVWGTPVATEDDAERAVRTALDLVAAVQALGQELGAEGLRARAGVLTGEAAVNLAAVGEGMVAGDLVNTASRIQSVAEPGSVFVGEATRRATEGTVVHEPAGRFELKGKDGETTLWRALRVVSGRAGALKSEGLEAPFVGRDRELRQIKDLFHVSAEEGRAQLVSVTGIAGIGKSRLAWEFYKYFDGIVQTIYWHRGRCLAYGEGVTYWALADMVRWRCGIAEDDLQKEAQRKLQAALEEHLLDPEERRFVEPRLAQLLALGEGSTYERQDLFAAWRLFFERLADTYPTVLAFEDMQWADASLLDFVEYLLEWSRDKPLFVITLARPELLEKRPNWGAGHRNFTSLFLEPLSEQAMEELLIGLVPGLSAPLRSQILARAEGVPLYAVETVRMLLDRGLVVEDGSAYMVVGEVDTLEVPETLHALIAARLDGLSADERRLLSDASVLGKTFTPRALTALSGLEAERLEELLTALVRREVLGIQSDPRSPEQGQYSFLQDLLRYVAYETLPKRQRREKHLAAAEHLAATLGEDEVAEVIAAHYVAAYEAAPDAEDASQIKGKARLALVRAATRATSLGAAAEARRYYEQAAALAEESLVRVELMAQAAVAAGYAGDPEAAFALATEASDDLDPHAAARLWLRVGRIITFGGRRDEIVKRLEGAYEVMKDDSDEDAALLAAELAFHYWFNGDPEQSMKHAERAIDLAEALRAPLALARSLRAYGQSSFSRGREQLADAAMKEALAISLEHELVDDAAVCYFILSDGCFRRDRYAEALGYLEEALALSRRVGHRPHEWAVLAERTYPLWLLGRWDEAIAVLETFSQEQLDAGGVMLSLLQSGIEIHASRGDVAKARQVYEAFRRIERSSDVQDQTMWLAATAALSRAEGRLQDALVAGLATIENARTLSPSFQGIKHAVTDALDAALMLGDAGRADELFAFVDELPPARRPPYLETQVLRLRSRVSNDGAGLATAARRFAELEAPFPYAITRLEQAELTDDESAREEALEIFARLGARPWLERAGRIVAEHEAPLVG